MLTDAIDFLINNAMKIIVIHLCSMLALCYDANNLKCRNIFMTSDTYLTESKD